MKKNIGNIERVVRIAAGLAILSLAFVGPQSPWAYLGVVPLFTGFVGWCPPYALFGISTCKASNSVKNGSCAVK
jgi:Inner membrane protein YgaP-like, transmembrane domain